MHPDFAEWYRAVSLEPQGDELANRWRGIEALASKLDADDIVELARLAIRRPSMKPESMERIQGAFVKTDPAFKRHGNAAELSILAGATLVQAMSKGDGSRAGMASALALECAYCAGFQGGEFPKDFVAQARQYLVTASRNLRANERWPAGSKLSLKVDVSSAQSNPTVMASELEKVAKAILELHKENSEWAAAVQRRIQLQQEEIDVAWWVFGGRSSDVGAPVAKIPPAAAPLALGRELGEMITILPGPLSGEALLERMLEYLGAERPKKVTLEEAIFATNPEWRSTWVARAGADSTGDVLPILAAVRHAAEGARASEWRTWVKRSLGIRYNASFELAVLAQQVYRECLAMRALSALRKGTAE